MTSRLGTGKSLTFFYSVPGHLAQGADPDEVPVLHPGDEDADEADEGELHEGEEDHHEADHHEDVQSCSQHSINNIFTL